MNKNKAAQLLGKLSWSKNKKKLIDQDHFKKMAQKSMEIRKIKREAREAILASKKIADLKDPNVLKQVQKDLEKIDTYGL